MIAINQRHLDRVSGKWTSFDDKGNEFMDADHPYAGDLDVVGDKSLFQYINITHTWHGRTAFAGDMMNAQYKEQEIMKRQAAVRELSADSDFAGEMEHRFSQIGSDPAAATLVKELQENHVILRNKALRTLIRYGPLAVLLFVGLVVIFRWEQLYLLSVCLYALQTLIWIVTFPFTSKTLAKINRLPFKLGAYSKVLTFIAGASFQSEKLRQIQDTLTQSNVSAVHAIRELARLSDKTSVRSNPIVYFILNAVLLWDWECVFQFEEWSVKYASHCESWFIALGEMESLSCFAVLKNVCSHTCFPSFTRQYGIVAEELGHPLIPNASRVTNPLSLNDEIIIISGSNMSGKTTYLRTVGINVVLARAGGPVCAEKMILSDLHIVTSMRTFDNLSEGVSTFYAELRRIKGVLDAAKRDRNTRFLLDEIFRGTNSVDRLSGARAVITKLSQIGVIGMLTTHDLDLCQMERANDKVSNYNFSEQYEKGQICFDYKMQPGISKTTNARYLMEWIGIV